MMPSNVWIPIEHLWLKGGSVVKNPPTDAGSTFGLGRCPGEGNSHPLQYSCLGNSTDRGAWWAIVHGVTVGLNWATGHLLYATRSTGAYRDVKDGELLRNPHNFLQSVRTSILRSLMISTNIYRFTFMFQVLGRQRTESISRTHILGPLLTTGFYSHKSNQGLKCFKSDRKEHSKTFLI